MEINRFIKIYNSVVPTKEGQQYSNDFYKVCIDKKIDTDLRVCHFLSQLSHESIGMTALHENMNYSTEGLLKVFPKYFDKNTANEYARKPTKIANKVYSNRMGNGDETSGEGSKYIGRSAIHLTGKKNYSAVSEYLFKDDRLVKDPELVNDKSIMPQVCAWFWTTNNINKLADPDDVVGVTKAINGGKIGLEEREKKLKIAKQAIGLK